MVATWEFEMMGGVAMREPSFASSSAVRAVAEVSHDLRSSVAALQLLVEGVADGVVRVDGGSPWALRMVAHVRLVSDLVRQLDDSERLGAASGAVSETAIAPLIDRWLQAMRFSAEANGITLEGSSEGQLPAVLCQPEQISRVLLNLLDNAIRHTAPGGTVTLRATSQVGGVRVEVHDTGPGIPSEVCERVARCASTDVSTGLGLGIARTIVEAHGGQLSIPSIGEGATVRFSLPAAPVD